MLDFIQTWNRSWNYRHEELTFTVPSNESVTVPQNVRTHRNRLPGGAVDNQLGERSLWHTCQSYLLLPGVKEGNQF